MRSRQHRPRRHRGGGPWYVKLVAGVAAIGVIIVVDRWPFVKEYLGYGTTAVAPIGKNFHGPLNNCAEAGALGLEDIPSNSPYYGAWMDGDGDGLACEPVGGGRR